jgi:hypothetical protein
MEDHNVTAKFSKTNSDLRNRGQGLKLIIYDTTRPVPLKQPIPAHFRNAIRPFSRAENFTCPVQELKERQCFQVDTGGRTNLWGNRPHSSSFRCVAATPSAVKFAL